MGARWRWRGSGQEQAATKCGPLIRTKLRRVMPRPDGRGWWGWLAIAAFTSEDDVGDRSCQSPADVSAKTQVNRCIYF